MSTPPTGTLLGTSRVCVVGSLNMDLVIRAPRIPTPGETVLGGGYRTFPGGKGANQAVAAARAGSIVTLIGRVGDDPHGARVREALTTEKIDLAHVRTAPGEATGLALITVAESGENAIVVSPGTNANLSPSDIEASAIAITSADALLVQLEISLACVAAAIKIARGAGKPVVLNAAPARPLPPDLAKQIDMLVVNQSEAMRLLNVEAKVDPARLALRLLDLGVGAVLVTLGANGALLAYRGRLRRVPTPHVKSVDSVGAGDAVCGVLASCMGEVARATASRDPSEGETVERAAVLACAAGALAATKPGSIAAMPKAEEILEAARELRVT